MTRPPFVGRAHELERALALLGPHDGATLAVFGPPGIGKTALLEALRDRLEVAGLDVERVVGSPAAADLPLTPFSRYLDPTGDHTADLGASVAKVVNALRAAGRTAPTFLLVDDAHGLDDASVVVVSQLAHSEEVRVVLVARSTEALPADLEHLVDGPGVEHLEIRPLSAAETEELVRQDLGGRGGAAHSRGAGRAEVSGQVLDRLWRASEGVPFHVRDLLDSSVRSGALARDDDRRWVQRERLVPSTRFADALGRRVEQLGDECSALVRAIAVAGPLPLRLAASIASPERRLAAERAGILRRRAVDPTSDTVDFAHDLYREAAVSWLGGGERLRIAADVAQLLAELPAPSPDDEVLRAEVSLLAGTLGSSDPAVYERAAEVACHLHLDGARALHLAEAALARGAGTRAALLRLEALGLLRRFDEANTGFAELGSSVDDPRDAAKVCSAYAWHLVLNLGDVKAADAVAAGSPWMEHPSEVPQALVSGLISGLSVIGRAEEASRLADLTLKRSPSGEDDHFVDLSVVWSRLLARWQLGRLGELSGPFDGLPATEPPRPASAWMRTAMTASFELLRGRLGDAARRHDSVRSLVLRGPPQVVAMNSVLHAAVEAQLGRPDRATELLAALDDLPPGTTVRHRWWVARARIMSAAAQGALTDAVRASIELADAHAGEHFYVTTSLHDVVRFGRAKFVQDRLAEQARRPNATWWDLVCAEHGAAAAADQRDPARLLAVADRFRRGGRALDALEATAQAMTAAERATAPGSSKALGIVAASRLKALLDVCGPARTPLLVTVPRALTEREYLVARLAASGASNAEIARRLGTSARTVGNQLQSVYQKLGLHSREELGFLDE